MAEHSASKTAAFELFVATRGTAMLRTAVFLAGDPHTGEDLLQDVLLRAYRHWRRVDDPDAYVRRALVNAAASRRRQRRFREDPLDTATVPIPDSAPDGTDTLSNRDLLFTALRQLPPRQRAVIVLRYFDDLGETQIATSAVVPAKQRTTHDAPSRLGAVGEIRDQVWGVDVGWVPAGFRRQSREGEYFRDACGPRRDHFEVRVVYAAVPAGPTSARPVSAQSANARAVSASAGRDRPAEPATYGIGVRRGPVVDLAAEVAHAPAAGWETVLPAVVDGHGGYLLSTEIDDRRTHGP